MVQQEFDSHIVQLADAMYVEIREVLKAFHRAATSSRLAKQHIEDVSQHLVDAMEKLAQQKRLQGALSAAVRRAPRLATQAEELDRQLELLQEKAEGLHMLARSGIESPAWWNRIVQQLDQFTAEFVSHERAEHQLLTQSRGSNGS